MVSKAQSAANARTAARVIARELGFFTDRDGGGFVVADLSPENQVRLGDALADYVSRHPALFDADAMASARYHLSLSATGKPLARPGASLDDYAGALLSQATAAADAVGGIGRGVLNTAKLAEIVLPLGALFVVGFLLYGFFLRQKQSA